VVDGLEAKPICGSGALNNSHFVTMLKSLFVCWNPQFSLLGLHSKRSRRRRRIVMSAPIKADPQPTQKVSELDSK